MVHSPEVPKPQTPEYPSQAIEERLEKHHVHERTVKRVMEKRPDCNQQLESSAEAQGKEERSAMLRILSWFIPRLR